MRALLVALLCAPTIADAGPCAVPTLGPRAMTAQATTIASDGGVLVSLVPSYGDDTADVTTWRFHTGKQLVKPAIVTLAPGLMSLALPANGGNTLVIENGAHAPLLSVTRGGKVNLLAAPRVRKASAQLVPGGPRSSQTNEVLVDLIAAPPTEAVALVIFGIDKQTTTARSWAAVSHEELSWVVYRSGGRCSMTLPGTVPSSAGDHVAFAWVDRSGRLSTMSAEVVVAAASPGRGI